MTQYTLSLEIIGKDKASGVFDRVDRGLRSIMSTALGVTTARIFEDIGEAIMKMGIQALNAVSYVQVLEITLGSLATRELVMMSDGTLTVADAFDQGTAKARELVHELGRVAILSPYTLDATANTYRMMVAFGSTTDQATLLTQGLLTMGSGLGASNEQIQRMAYNLAQIALEGKVTALDVRQLALAGLPLLDVLKKVGVQMGVEINDIKDFNKAWAEGKITWQDFSEGFAEYADTYFGGASERMARSLYGLKSTFKDVFQLTMPRILGPAVDEVTGILSRLLDSFLAIYEDPRLAEIGENLAAKVSKWTAPVKGAVDQLTADLTGGEDIVGSFKTFFGNIGTIIKQGIASTVQGAIASIPNVVTWISNLFAKILTSIATHMPKVGSLILQVIQGVATSLTTQLPNLLNLVASTWSQFFALIETSTPTILTAALGVIDTFVNSIVAYAPGVIAQIVSTVTAVAPQLATAFATVFATVLPAIIALLPQIATAAVTVLTALIPIATQLIITLVGTVIAMLPQIVQAGVQILQAIIQGLVSVLPQLLMAAVAIVLGLLSAIVEQLPVIIATIISVVDTLLPVIITVGLQMVVALVEGILSNIPMITAAATQLELGLIDVIVKNLPLLLVLGIQLVMALIEGITAALPQYFEAGARLFSGLLEVVFINLPAILDAGVMIIFALINGIIGNLPSIIDAGMRMVFALVQGLIDNMPLIVAAIIQIIVSIIDTLQGSSLSILYAIISIVQMVIMTIIDYGPTFLKLGGDLIVAIAKGLILAIPELWKGLLAIGEQAGIWMSNLLESFKAFGKGLLGALKEGILHGDWSGFATLFEESFAGLTHTSVTAGYNLAEGLGEGFNTNLPNVQSNMETQVAGLFPGVQASFPAYDMGLGWGTDLTDGLESGVGATMPSTQSSLEALMAGMSPGVQASFPAYNIGLGWGTGLTDGVKSGVNTTMPATTQVISTQFGKLPNKILPMLDGGGEGGGATNVGKTLVKNAESGFTTAWPKFSDNVNTSFGSLPPDVAELLEGQMQPIGTSVTTDFTEGFDEGFVFLEEDAQTKMSMLVSTIDASVGDTTPIGQRIMDGIRNGMESRFGNLLARARQMAAQIAHEMSRALQISSPSKVFMKIGEEITRGLALGMESQRMLPVRATQHLLEPTYSMKGSTTIHNNYYTLNMPTSSSPADVRTAFKILQAYGSNL